MVALARAKLRLRRGGWQGSLAMSPGRHRGRSETALHDRASELRRVADLMPLHFSCLERALALAALLRDDGFAAAVRVGGKKAGSFSAHAWVEADGQLLAVTDEGSEDYQPFVASAGPAGGP